MSIARGLTPLIVLAAIVALGTPATAEGRNVLSASDVNMRSGPAGGFRKIATVVKDQIVTVHGCARGYLWCDIDWAGYRGWVSAKHLRLPRMSGGLAGVAKELGIPAVKYSAAEYEARHYAVHAEPAGAELIRRRPDGATVPVQYANDGREAGDVALVTDGPTSKPADNSDILGGDIPK